MLVAKALVVVAMGGADSLGWTLVVTVADVVVDVAEGEGETPRAAAEEAFLRFPPIVSDCCGLFDLWNVAIDLCLCAVASRWWCWFGSVVLVRVGGCLDIRCRDVVEAVMVPWFVYLDGSFRFHTLLCPVAKTATKLHLSSSGTGVVTHAHTSVCLTPCGDFSEVGAQAKAMGHG